VGGLWFRRSVIGAICILACVLTLVLQQLWDAARLASHPHGWFVVDTVTTFGGRGRSMAQSRRAIGGPFATEALCRNRFPTVAFDGRGQAFLSCQELTIADAEAIWDRSYGKMP